ncbi:hypothetical protein WDU94_002381 [Cyamophila willieti]
MALGLRTSLDSCFGLLVLVPDAYMALGSQTSLDRTGYRTYYGSSPPPDLDYVSEKRKSRRDISPPDHKRGHPTHPHPHPMTMDPVRRVSTGSRGVPPQGRSHSAASASHSPRSRSKSPPHRSLSPPYRLNEPPGVVLPTYAYVPRFHSRSATATPVSSPKKHRQLPQIPSIKDQALKERVAQDQD